jgi:hypothetical protein
MLSLRKIIKKLIRRRGFLIDIVPDAHLYCNYPLGEAALPESFSFFERDPVNLIRIIPA